MIKKKYLQGDCFLEQSTQVEGIRENAQNDLGDFVRKLEKGKKKNEKMAVEGNRNT